MHFTKVELESHLNYIFESPQNNGELKMIVSRPDVDLRAELNTGMLSKKEGLIGDSWKNRSSRHTPDNSPFVDVQLTLMNSRVIDALTADKKRWALAGDQLFVDLDLSEENLPPGSRLKIGESIVEISKIPHNGCGKFKERFGSDALKFVNSPLGKKKHFRGLNAKVIKEGIIKIGDTITKL